MKHVLNGSTVLVTGAGRGLGPILAEALAATGARLVLTGRDADALGAVAERLAATAVPADLTDPDGPARVVEAALARHGRIDVLVNNAGIGGPVGPLWETDEAEWWDAMATNLGGTARMCRAALPAMIEQGAGRIVNIVSFAGRDRWPHAGAYSVSKAAVIKLGENLAAETAPHGVGVFNYHPGLVDAGLTGDHLERGETGEPWADRILGWLRQQRDAGGFTPIGRSAAGVVALASGAADERSGAYFTPEDFPEDAAREKETAWVFRL